LPLVSDNYYVILQILWDKELKIQKIL
jgi:hypothetical protein